MSWLLPRLLAGLALMLAGSALGYVAGAVVGWPFLGAALGAMTVVLLAMAVDGLRALRLLAWLRDPEGRASPRDAGVWGELAYRVERNLRQRDAVVAQEKERLAQFLSAIEASPNGVMLLDRAGQIEWCNRMAAEHFGLDPQRDLRQHVTNLVRAPAFVHHLQSEAYDQPVTFPSSGGRGTLSVLVRPYGEGMKLVLSQDITERERAETMRRDFVANVSHEIRTPLTVLAGFIETLANLPLTEVERKRVLALMSQQTQRMQTLVSDLLTLAQLEGSPRPPADRWVPVSRLMRTVEGDALTLSQGRHELRFRTEGEAMIAGAEAELLSALGNLVTNAVRYTQEGGCIDVRWTVRPDGSGEFSVKDTGIGIAKEHLPRLTERFYRVDGSRSRETGGTGLGLSIVKHVVQRHGGELDIHSELGKGSEFRIIFPALRVKRVEPMASSSVPLSAR